MGGLGLKFTTRDVVGVIAGFLFWFAYVVVSGCSTNCRVVKKCYPRDGLPDVCIDQKVCD